MFKFHNNLFPPYFDAIFTEIGNIYKYILELQEINHITCLEQKLIMDYSTFAFIDQKCGTPL